MKHYLVRPGHTIEAEDGSVLAKAGEVLGLDTDSEDARTRKDAEYLLRKAGGSEAVTLVDSPPQKKSKKKSKSKGGYKTRAMNADDSASETSED